MDLEEGAQGRVNMAELTKAAIGEQKAGRSGGNHERSLDG